MNIQARRERTRAVRTMLQINKEVDNDSSVILRLNRDRRSHRYRVEQFLYISIFQRHAAPCPIAACAVSVNVNISAEFRVLRWLSLSLYGVHDCVMLRTGNQ